MTLRYPTNSGGVGAEYVLFQPMPYRSNASGGAGGPAAGGAQACMLYMPNSTPAVQNQNYWNSSEDKFAGPLGAAKRDLAMAATNAIQDVGTGNNADLVDRMKSQLTGMSSQAGGIAKQMITNQVEKMVGVGPGQMLALTRGQVYNPNVELLYSAPKMRVFSFNFDFVPKNAAEGQIVNQIIKNFKVWSSPQPNGGMFEVPHVWQVTYMAGGSPNQNMNKFKKAALTSVGVQANSQSDMHVSHYDYVPIMTSISLSFMEVDIITRDDQNQGGQGY